MDSDPPFLQSYKTLIDNTIKETSDIFDNEFVIVEECELPLIDLSRLLSVEESETEECKKQIATASQEWGFFQVINHGISRDILEKMRNEQVKVFKQPFDKKSKEDKFMNFPAGSYRWGTPTATCLKQLSWSEAFHIPMTAISADFGSLRYFYNTSSLFIYVTYFIIIINISDFLLYSFFVFVFLFYVYEYLSAPTISFSSR